MLNHAVIQGRLVAGPELRTTQSGVAVCSFRVAWSETYKEAETRLFLTCTAWRGTGELIAKQFTKGKEIVVEGKLSTRDWTDKEGGRRQAIEMTVDRAHFCGPKDGAASKPRAAGRPVDVDAAQFSGLDDDDGELPF